MALIIKDKDLREADISAEELRLEIAILLYEQERLSLGKASAFANMNRILFLKELGKRKISVHYDVEDLEEDIQSLGLELNDHNQ